MTIGCDHPNYPVDARPIEPAVLASLVSDLSAD
jgi:hypothetical protein